MPLVFCCFSNAWVLLKHMKVQCLLKLGTAWPSNRMNLLHLKMFSKNRAEGQQRYRIKEQVSVPTGEGHRDLFISFSQLSVSPQLCLSSLHKLHERSWTWGPGQRPLYGECLCFHWPRIYFCWPASIHWATGHRREKTNVSGGSVDC